jgi:hypothetical protein
MLEFLAFFLAAIASPQGCAVGALFAAGIWSHVGIQALMNRHAERVHLAELNGILADMPTPDRAQKRLVPDHRRSAA